MDMAPPPETARFDQAAVLAALRARVARLEGVGRAVQGAEAIPVCDGLALPGGGLSRAALHEVMATSPGCGAAFCAVLLARTGGTVLWISSGGGGDRPWPPGLARCGLTPDRLVLVRAERWADALWAMEEALRCPAVSGAMLAADGSAAETRLDLTATRRLQLAAETGGGLGLLLRADAVQTEHTAAATRWRIGSLHGGRETALDDPRWQLELLRARGGRPGGPWAVTWREAAGRIELDGTAAEVSAA